MGIAIYIFENYFLYIYYFKHNYQMLIYYSTVIYSATNCVKTPITSLVAVGMTFLRYSKPTSTRIIYIRVGSILTLTLITQ